MVYFDTRDEYNIANNIVRLLNQEGSCRIILNSLTYTIHDDCKVSLVNWEYLEITSNNDELKAVFKISEISGVVV